MLHVVEPGERPREGTGRAADRATDVHHIPEDRDGITGDGAAVLDDDVAGDGDRGAADNATHVQVPGGGQDGSGNGITGFDGAGTESDRIRSDSGRLILGRGGNRVGRVLGECRDFRGHHDQRRDGVRHDRRAHGYILRRRDAAAIALNPNADTATAARNPVAATARPVSPPTADPA